MQTRNTKLFIQVLGKMSVNQVDQELFELAQRVHYQYAIFFIRNLNLKLNLLPLEKVFAYPELKFAQGYRDRLKTAILKEDANLFLEMLQKIDHENICLDADTFDKASQVSSKALAHFFVKNLNSVYNGFGLYSRKIPKLPKKKPVYLPKPAVVKNTSSFARERLARKERLAKLPVIKAINANQREKTKTTILFPIKKSPIQLIKKSKSCNNLLDLSDIKLEPITSPRPLNIIPKTKPKPMPSTKKPKQTKRKIFKKTKWVKQYDGTWVRR
jgi:hypothetical protein